jgi:hypothetical protein
MSLFPAFLKRRSGGGFVFCQWNTAREGILSWRGKRLMKQDIFRQWLTLTVFSEDALNGIRKCRI